MELRDLGKAFAEQSLKQAVIRAESGDLEALDSLIGLGLDKIPSEKRVAFASRYYARAKESLAQRDIGKARTALGAAHKLHPAHAQYTERAGLLKNVVPFGTAEWRKSLRELQSGLAEFCTRAQCTCASHFKIASCRAILGEGFPNKRTLNGITVYTLGPYYSRAPRGKWTKLLKTIKRPPYDAKPLRPMADIVADFVIEQTTLLVEADVIVPIPPAITKFSERNFAPNDIVAERLGSRLALPVSHALRRKPGVPTREASDAELRQQFEISASFGRGLENLFVLLVEDIWTAGRTIPICAKKIQEYKPRGIVALALGHTEG